jgi:hypothetical protein
VTGELLCQCGCRIVEWVHGHGQCQNCKRNVFPCCSGEVADGLPGGAGNDFAYSDRNYPAVQTVRPCVCHGLLDLAYCGICGTANICESEPDVDDLVKAA